MLFVHLHFLIECSMKNPLLQLFLQFPKSKYIVPVFLHVKQLLFSKVGPVLHVLQLS